MKILVIGSGGREHALCWKISQSKKTDKIFCAPGNPGTATFAENIPIAVTDLDSLLEFAKQKKIDLTIVGPEGPLIAGIVDLFEENGMKIVGPSKRAARIEGSKVFAKKVMLWNKIPTAQFACFDDFNYATKFLDTQKYPLVIKAEGQCLGKGVMVCTDKKAAKKFAKEVMVDKIFGSEGKKIVIEEYLTGQEVSFMAATDGKDFISLLPSQDHKRIYDRDKGPNTGGMGAYAPVPFIKKKMIKRIENEIITPLLKALSDHDNPYRGILYPGIIMTADGPKVLEFNCRFGDPETQPVLSLLKSDIIDLFEAIVDKKIGKIKLSWKNAAALCVVLASKGYPGVYEKGMEIHGLDRLTGMEDVFAFQAGTVEKKGVVATGGGRVMGITALAKNLEYAKEKAYGVIGSNGIYFSGMQFRKDIGDKGFDKKLWKYLQKK